jgi:hypothetical protein
VIHPQRVFDVLLGAADFALLVRATLGTAIICEGRSQFCTEDIAEDNAKLNKLPAQGCWNGALLAQGTVRQRYRV